MSCDCNNLASTCYAKPSEFEFVKNFEYLEVGTNNWRQLYVCKICSQVWTVEHEEIMNKSLRRAFKLNSKAEFLTYNYQESIELLKISDKGGISDKECLQKGCSNKALLNCYLCAKHY